MDVLLSTIADTLLYTLLAMSVLAVAAGLWLLMDPASFSGFSRLANRWVSTRTAGGWLETPRYIERFFYRHHKVFGGLLMVGAAFATYRLAFVYSQAKSLATLITPAQDVIAEAFASSLVAFLLFGNFVAFFIGAAVLGRPSLLKGIEATSNRWISTQKAYTVLDSTVDAPDRLASRHPRLLGIVIIAGGLYAVLQLGMATL